MSVEQCHILFGVPRLMVVMVWPANDLQLCLLTAILHLYKLILLSCESCITYITKHVFIIMLFLCHREQLVTGQEPSKQGTIWHISYWFIIGTAPLVRVFMCIHVNTRFLPVVTSFEQVCHESYWFRTGTV